MTDDRHETALTVSKHLETQPETYNKTAKVTAVDAPVQVVSGLDTTWRVSVNDTTVSAIRAGEAANSGYVPHLTRGDIQRMATVAARDPRHGRRDAALIRTVYDAALRITEALDIRYVDLVQTPDGWTVSILDSSKTRANTAAISAGTVSELTALCYELHRAPTDKIFGISRSQAYRVIVDAYEKSGVRRPGKATDGVGAVHILRHTGALERLKASGNPRSVQAQLRHRSAAMTMRYLRTQQQDESIAIQAGIDTTW